MRRWLALAVAALVGGASSTPAMAADSDASLVGRSFRSVQVTEAGFDAPLVPGTRLSLVFIDSSHLGASAGCNSYGAVYRLIGSHLLIKADVQTLIACPDDLQRQEQWLFGLLRASPTIAVSATGLALGEGDLLVQFLDSGDGAPMNDPQAI
jgi:heat shock protein HslJ